LALSLAIEVKVLQKILQASTR